MDLDDTLKERDKAHEAKYKLDEELRFKARSRRNKLFGLWAAERLGLEDRDSYARDVVFAGMGPEGGDAVAAKVLADFRKKGIAADRGELHAALDGFHNDALEQLRRDFPTALGPDHEKVGD